MWKIIVIFGIALFLILAGCTAVVHPPKPEESKEVITSVPPIECLDTLGVATYPGMLKHVPKNIMTRGFHQTFGNYIAVMDDEFQEGRIIQGINGPWDDGHNYGDKNVPGIKKLGAKLSKFFEKYPGITIFWSPFTEHKLNNFDKYGDIAQASCPKCRIVNSVWTGSYSKKYQNEVHGGHKKPEGIFLNPGVSYSSDGDNSPDQNFYKIFKNYSDAVFVCAWHWSFNLFYGASDPASRATRIREKNNRMPTKDIIKSILYLFLPPGSMNLSNKIYLLKSHAEKHDAQDLKGNKMMIITKVKANFVEFKKPGFSIKLPLFGSFSGCKGCWRYYWDKFGYVAGEALSVIINGNVEGKVNGGVRCCHYQN